MIICQKQVLQSMPLLLGFWWVLPSLISSVLHFKSRKDFSFSGHFMLSFSHTEHVFPARGCCRCSAGSARDGNATSVTKSGAHECSWSTEGLLFGFPTLHCLLLLGFWPLGMPVRGRGCRTGLGWLQGLHTDSEAGGWGTAWLSLWVFVEMGVEQGWCSTLQGTAGDSWSIHGRSPWNVLTKTGGLANCFSWCVMLYFVIPVKILLPRYCYSQLWWL